MYNLKCYSLSGTPTPIFSIFCRSYMRCYSRWCGLDCCNHYNCLQNEVIFKVSFNIWQYNSHCFELIQTCKIKQISSAIYTLTDHNIQIYIIYPVNLYQLNTREIIERHLGFAKAKTTTWFDYESSCLQPFHFNYHITYSIIPQLVFVRMLYFIPKRRYLIQCARRVFGILRYTHNQRLES